MEELSGNRYGGAQVPSNSTAVLGNIYNSYSGISEPRNPHHGIIRGPSRGHVHWLVNRSLNISFTGRSNDIQTIELALRTSTEEIDLGISRCFMVTGIGGQGKSELCLKVAYNLRQTFWGVFWVDVSSIASASSGFSRIARILDSPAQTPEGVSVLLSGLDRSWLLVLDNADNLKTDYQQYIPVNTKGVVLFTSRNLECARRYGSLGSLALLGLDADDCRKLLFKAAEIPASHHSELKNAADAVTNLLSCHPLAVLQAGYYVGRGHCTLYEYPKHFEHNQSRVLKFRGTTQQSSRYTTVYATFEASVQQLESSPDQAAVDALDLLHSISHLSFVSLPTSIFEAAWIGARAVLSCSSGSPDQYINLSRWHLDHSIPLLQPYTKNWDAYRLVSAMSILASLSLITITGGADCGTVSMHPLAHSWARERQVDKRSTNWLMAGATFALAIIDSGVPRTSRLPEPSSFSKHYRHALIPHLLAWAENDIEYLDAGTKGVSDKAQLSISVESYQTTLNKIELFWVLFRSLLSVDMMDKSDHLRRLDKNIELRRQRLSSLAGSFLMTVNR